MKLIFFIVQCWMILGVFSSCGEPECPDGFPTECKKTCGCLSLLADRAFFNSTDPQFLKSNPGNYVKPNIIWVDCQPVLQSCSRGTNHTVSYSIDSGRFNTPKRGFEPEISFDCVNNIWTVEDEPERLYYYTCKV